LIEKGAEDNERLPGRRGRREADAAKEYREMKQTRSKAALSQYPE